MLDKERQRSYALTLIKASTLIRSYAHQSVNATLVCSYALTLVKVSKCLRERRFRSRPSRLWAFVLDYLGSPSSCTCHSPFGWIYRFFTSQGWIETDFCRSFHLTCGAYTNWWRRETFCFWFCCDYASFLVSNLYYIVVNMFVSSCT